MLNPNKPTTSDRDATRASTQDVDQPSLVDLIMAVSSSEERQEVPLMRTTFEAQHCRLTRKQRTSSTPPQLLEVLNTALFLIAEDVYLMN
jgi:hypothetical protein